MTLNKFSNYFKILRSFLGGCFVGIFLIFLILSGMVLFIRNKYQGKVYPGVFIFGKEVSGKSASQLEEFLKEKEEEIKNLKVAFFWKNEEEKRWEITPQKIDWSVDSFSTINEALTKGHEGGVKEVFSLYQLLLFPLEIKPNFVYSQEKLEKVLEEIAAEVDRPVQDALFEFKGGKVVSFQVSKEGREVDRWEVKKLIILAFSEPRGEKYLVSLDLPVKVVEPKITTKKSNELGIHELLAEGESFFKDSIPSRVHNIILASSYLHGVVIPPGEVFSFAKKIGTISAEVGYKPAYVIKNKATVLEDGGGVCQVSTTLFRAALNAGLPIVERKAHYYRVGFYEQGG